MEALVRETEEKKGIINSRTATFPLIFLLGVATVIGTQISYWNEGLVHGFWPLAGSLLFMVSGYICLAFCLCEMSAALPFSGGTFGLARVTLGQIPGYMIGAFETVEYVMYVMLIAHSTGEMITDVSGADRKYEPIYWVAFYLSGFVIQLGKPTIMWSFIAFSGVCILVYMIVFAIGAPGPANASFSRYAVEQNSFKNAPQFLFNWFRCMPYTSWFFLGIETLPLASGDTVQANKTIPRAIQAVVLTVILSSAAVVFTASSIFPGAVDVGFQHSWSPLSYGYSAMMGITHSQSLIGSIIIKYITGFGFMFAYGRQIAAMQRSGLLMTRFRLLLGETHVLRRGMIAAALVGLLILSCTWSLNNGYMKNYHSACLLGNYLVCLGILSSYIQFRVKFISLVKNYKSPLGMYGARYGILVFTIAFVSLAGFQNDSGMALLTLSILMAWMIIRYLFFNLGKPIISTEEQSVLFVLYVINANTVRKKLLMEQALARSREPPNNNTSSRFSNSSASNSLRSMTEKIKRGTGTISKYISGHRLQQSSDDDSTAPTSPSRTTNNSRHITSNSGQSSRRPSLFGANLLGSADMVVSFDENETDVEFGDAVHLELITRAYDSALNAMSGRHTPLPLSVYVPLDEDSRDVSPVASSSQNVSRVDRDLFTSDFDNDDSQASIGSNHNVHIGIRRGSSIKALRRSFSTADSMGPPLAEFDTPDRKQGSSKKLNFDFGRISHKFSATENSTKNGKVSRGNSIDSMTIDSFAAEERTRAAILENIQSQTPEDVIAILSPPRSAPDQGASDNNSSNNRNNDSVVSTADRWRGRGAFSPVQDTIEEIEARDLSKRLSEREESHRRKPQISLKLAPSPRNSAQVDIEPSTFSSSSQKQDNKQSLGIAQKGVSSRQSSTYNSVHSSPLPSPRDTTPFIASLPPTGSVTTTPSPKQSSSRFKFNFKLFGGGTSGKKPPLSPVTHSGKHVSSPNTSHRSMDASILAMYHDEVEEYFSHNSEELPYD